MNTLVTPYPWQKKITERLQEQLNSPPQALCFSGAIGSGQEALAESFAQALLNTQQLEMHPDYLSISPEPGKSIGIDAVREIHDFCLIPTTQAQRKIVRLTSVESLTLPAQQAVLKTLEEPVIPTTFILTCAQPNKLLPTVRSRCQLIALPSVPYSEAKAWLNTQRLAISPDAYTLCDGGPLMIGTPEFETRQEAYRFLKESVTSKTDPLLAAKLFIKAEPLDVLTGFYYALMHSHQFALLDTCIALRKKYAENANLNWEMQLHSFLIEATHHAR
jgi:DNA polymerase III subunit delta'